MEVYIYQVNSKELIGERLKEDLIFDFPESMQKRALRYKFETDAADYIAGKLLLKKALEELGSNETLADVQYEQNGKPYLQSVNFNISHSSNRILLAFSQEGKLGVDIERTKPVVLENFRSFFTKKEWSDILNDENSVHRFFWYWTRKESIIKALGVNLAYLHQVEVQPTKDYFIDKGKKWFMEDLKLGEGFIGAICTETRIRSFR